MHTPIARVRPMRSPRLPSTMPPASMAAAMPIASGMAEMKTPPAASICATVSRPPGASISVTNTIAPSAPLLSIFTSKFSASAAGAISRTAMLAAIRFGNMACPFREQKRLVLTRF